MKLHTELLRLRALLLEELSRQGFLPWRDVESVEADLSGGELVIRFCREGFQLFPVLRRFARQFGLELASWDPEEKRCCLAVREEVPSRERSGPRVPGGDSMPGKLDYLSLKMRYAAAVRAAFRSGEGFASCLEAVRAAWDMERYDFASLWLDKVGEEGLGLRERVRLHLWRAFLIHQEESRGGRRSFPFTRLQYGKVLSLDPRNFFALFNLGLVARSEGRREEAARFLGKALAVRPWDQETARLLISCRE